MEQLPGSTGNTEQREKPHGPEWMSEKPKLALQQLYKWTRFLGIAGSIIAAFILLNGLALFAQPQLAQEALDNMIPGLNARSISLVYIVLGFVYIIPMRMLLRFSRQLELYFKREDAAQALEALVSLSSFFKFIGVMVLIVLGLYILTIMGSTIRL